MYPKRKKEKSPKTKEVVVKHETNVIMNINIHISQGVGSGMILWLLVMNGSNLI